MSSVRSAEILHTPAVSWEQIKKNGTGRLFVITVIQNLQKQQHQSVRLKNRLNRRRVLL